MTGASQALPSLIKETRALLPTCVACGVALALPALGTGGPLLSSLTVLIFGVGAVALGAQSIGHEYAHHTLSLLLFQPSDRRRLCLLKAGVLMAMVLALALVAEFALLTNGAVRAGTAPRHQQALLAAAALSALCLAPWLSMLCRGTLPSLVFTMAIPGLLALAGEIAGTVQYGFSNRAAVEGVRLSVLWWALSVTCVVSAVAGWRMFMRLEAVEGHQAMQMPRWWRPAGEVPAAPTRLRTQHPAWLLVVKELRLQQMAFVVVGLYTLAWALLSLLETLAPEFPRNPRPALTLLYLWVLAILTGSLASAEERHLGTLPWQTLLPMAEWKQWMVKASTTIGLVVLLGIVLPLVLNWLHPADDNWSLARPLLAVLLLTAGSLYVSSLCTSGVKAMVMSLPLLVGSAMYAATLNTVLWAAAYRMFHETMLHASPAFRLQWIRASVAVQWSTQVMTIAAGVALTLLLLRFAFVNHRTAERSTRRTVFQGTVLFALVTLAVALPIALWVLYVPR